MGTEVAKEDMDLFPKGSEMWLIGIWLRNEIQKPSGKCLLTPSKGRELLALTAAWVALFSLKVPPGHQHYQEGALFPCSSFLPPPLRN